ncbi:MAG: TonB-dependent receptor [Bacteroidota bacterium]
MSRIVTALLFVGALLLTGASPAFAQQSVSGVVTDAVTGDPLPGVNIVVQGTTTGTVTNIDGEYGVTVPGPEAVLVYSYVGYVTFETVVGPRTEIDVALDEDAALIDEVVVVGYGTQRRGDVTSSVATVDVSDANVGSVTNADDLIQGRVAGVQVTQNNGEPGGGVSIKIRGGTSVSGSNEPLYVIDGVPIDNGASTPGAVAAGGAGAAPDRNPLNLLNPNDIESISVLKDAAATAIYGSRGANGVVLITTKDGLDGRVTVDYEGRTSVASAQRTIDLASGDQYRNFVTEAVGNRELGYDDLNENGIFEDSELVDNDGNGVADVIDNLGTASSDFQDAILRSAVSQQHNLSFAGGNQQTQYRASVSYLNQEGIITSSGLERITARINADTEAIDGRVRMGLNLTSALTEDDFVYYEGTGGFEGGLLTNVFDFNPTQPVRDENGDFFEVGGTSVRNPLGLAEEIADDARTTRTLGNAYLELDIIEGLTGRVSLGGDRSVSRRASYFPLSNPVGAASNAIAAQRDLQRSTVNFFGTLNYQRSFAERNNFSILGGYEFNETEVESIGIQSQGFVTDATSSYAIGSGTTPIAGSSFDETGTFSLREKNRLISFFSRTNYNFDQKYYLSASLRYDGSTRFGADNKWALFPAVSGAWRVSNEAFMNEVDFIDDLRLRAGFGIVGNQGGLDNGLSLALFEPNSDFRAVLGNEVQTGFALRQLPNETLKWEEKQEFTVGLDYGFLDNRFVGSIEFYRNTTEDLLLEITLPQPAPVPVFVDNVGSVRNTGLDFALDYYAIEKADMNLQFGFVFNTNANEVVDLGGQQQIFTGSVSGRGQSGQNALLLTPGEPFPVFYGAEFLRVNDAGDQVFNNYEFQAQDLNLDGMIDAEEEANPVQVLVGETTTPDASDRRIIGDPRPDFSYGLRTKFDYKQFGIGVFIRGEQGRELFNNTALIFSNKSAFPSTNVFADALDSPDGINEEARYSSRWIEDASFIRIDNITLEYRPDFSTYASFLRTTRFFLSIDNVFVFTPYEGFDPEVNTNAQVGAIPSTGIDYTNYPSPRTFTLGVNLGF